MAERRMFAKTVVDSDAFLDMSLSAQCLYFHLGMRADDDGFINNPRKIQRMIGAADDDMRILVAKHFIIPFKSGVMVIKHWKIHNYIPKDRYKPTVYQEERAQLVMKPNSAYTLVDTMDTDCIQSVDESDTQVRLGKDRLGKDRLGKVNEEIEPPAPPRPSQDSHIDYEIFRITYNGTCILLPSCRTITEKRKKAIRLFFKEFGLDDWKEICEKANASAFLTGNNDRRWKADIDFLLKTDKAAKVLEGTYDQVSTSAPKYQKSAPIYGGTGPGEAEMEAIRRLMNGG